MSKEEKAIEYYYSLKPLKYPTLIKLELKQIVTEETAPESEVTILLQSREPNDSQYLRLFFERVRELKINQSPLSEFSIPFIRIDSVKHYQWEDLIYRVKDEEEETLSFYCKNFEAALISK